MVTPPAATTTTTSMSTVTAAATSSGAERRRRTEIERRSRRRRQVRKEALLAETATLESVLAALQQRQQAQSRPLITTTTSTTSGEANEAEPEAEDDAMVMIGRCNSGAKPSRASAELLAKLQKIKLEIVGLVAERNQFQQLLEDHKTATRVMRVICEEIADSFETKIRQLDALCDEFFVSWTPQQCAELVRLGLGDFATFALEGDCHSTGASIGWEDRRIFDQRTLQLSFTYATTMLGIDTHRQFDEWWGMQFSDERIARGWYGAGSRVNFRFLQQVDENMYIVRRDVHCAGYDFTMHSIHLVYRVQTGRGYLSGIMSMPSQWLRSALGGDMLEFQCNCWTGWEEVLDSQGRPLGSAVAIRGWCQVPHLSHMSTAAVSGMQVILQIMSQLQMCRLPLTKAEQEERERTATSPAPTQRAYLEEINDE